MKLSLNIQIILGAVLGIIGGFLISKIGADTSTASLVLYLCGLGGSIFISLLKMILIPLVFVSIILGIANLRHHKDMHKVWKITLTYFLITPVLAATLGLFMMNTFKPGVGVKINIFEHAQSSMPVQTMSLKDFIDNFIVNLFMNPFKALAQGDILACIVFALFFGIALVIQADKAKTVINFLNESLDIIMIIINWIMKILPIGIFCLLLKLIATTDVSLFKAIGKYVVVVVAAKLIHGFIVLPLIIVIFARVKLSFFYKGFKDALITAFSTSSSNATLPVTFRCVTENLKVDKNIAGFVIPLGATVNMDGTALYEAAAALFIANLVGVDLNLVQQIIVVFMAVIASIGAPGIPSAGMVTMVMVFQSVGLPAEAIAILIPIDRPLDALRTMINVKGDAICCLIVQRHTNLNHP